MPQGASSPSWVLLETDMDLTQGNPPPFEQLQAAGFSRLRWSSRRTTPWTGYRPDLIREVAQQVAADNRASPPRCAA